MFSDYSVYLIYIFNKDIDTHIEVYITYIICIIQMSDRVTLRDKHNIECVSFTQVTCCCHKSFGCF